MACLFGHKWNGCKCEKCGKTRDEGHKWDKCKCTVCGQSRDEAHEVVSGNCINCGMKVTFLSEFTEEELRCADEILLSIMTAACKAGETDTVIHAKKLHEKFEFPAIAISHSDFISQYDIMFIRYWTKQHQMIRLQSGQTLDPGRDESYMRFQGLFNRLTMLDDTASQIEKKFASDDKTP